MNAPALADCLRDGALRVRVTTKASAERIRIEERPGEAPLVRVDVTVAPEKGKANAVVLALLAKALGRPKSELAIVQGETSRDKIVRVG
jgi:uncharacterized protein YggU (UPF0235/DUF167 family)